MKRIRLRRCHLLFYQLLGQHLLPETVVRTINKMMKNRHGTHEEDTACAATEQRQNKFDIL